MARWSSAWTRRGLLACVLVGAVFIPGIPSGSGAFHCAGSLCGSAGTISWEQPLGGPWLAEGGIVGTVPAAGQAYVAVGPQVAAVGYGMNVYGYDVRTGTPLWAVTLTGFPPGASIVSVRSWPQVVTAGVAFPAARTDGSARDEAVLLGQTGQQVRSYPATAYGGSVAADSASMVVVGDTSVTSYHNASGKPAWSRPTGPVSQAWRADGGSLFVTVAAGGYLGGTPVTALRKISLATGAERIVRPPHGDFAGALSAAFDGVVFFSGPAGLSAYNEATGRLLWQRPGAVPENEDPVLKTLYVTGGSGLVGLNPRTGAKVRRSAIPGPSGIYSVSGGVALGLDEGALGEAWGYAVKQRHVIWTTPPLPWPHYFIDLSGIGGSENQSGSMVLLAACAGLGGAAASGSGQVCSQPELVAVRS